MGVVVTLDEGRSDPEASLTDLVSLVAGLLGWPLARDWWQRIWPQEQRGDYRGAAGWRAAQGVRLVAFLTVFLPLVGVQAFVGSLMLQLWGVATLPFRLARRLTSRTSAKAG